MLYRHLSVNVSPQGNTTAFWTGRMFSETGLEHQAYIELYLSRNQDLLLGGAHAMCGPSIICHSMCGPGQDSDIIIGSVSHLGLT